MDQNTTMVQGLQVTEEKAKYDAACKRLLSEKQILARIMKTCLDEYKACTIDEIIKCIEGTPQVAEVPVLPDEEGSLIHGMDTEDKSLYEGSVTYDIRFRALLPSKNEQVALIINVEAQNKFNPGYPLIKRGIYYCARMISSQYGREFTGAHYEKVKKVGSIWICTHPTKEAANTITCFHITKDDIVGNIKEDIGNYDLLSVILVCLGGPEQDNYDGLLRMLDVLLSDKISVKEKQKILENDYDIQMSKEMEREVSSMCNLSDGVFARGEEAGMAKGLKKGEEIGTWKATLKYIAYLTQSLNGDVYKAMEMLQIPEEEYEKYIQALKDMEEFCN